MYHETSDCSRDPSALTISTASPFSDWLFTVPPGPRSVWAVVLWWEKRRIAYNAVLALVGVPSLLLFYLLVGLAEAVPPGEDAVEPFMLLLGPVLANVIYTAGWLVEVPVRLLVPPAADRLGPWLLKAGIAFSVFVVTLPALAWLVILMARVLGLGWPSWV